VHNVSQWPNLRHLSEPLEGAEGLLEAVSSKEATESACRGRTTDAESRTDTYPWGAAAATALCHGVSSCPTTSCCRANHTLSRQLDWARFKIILHSVVIDK